MEILQGIDLLKVKRVEKIYLNYEDKFLKKILTDLEIKQIKKKYPIINFRLKKLPFWKQKNFIEKDFERIINGKN